MAGTVAGLWMVTMVPVIAPAFRFTPLAAATWWLSAFGGAAMLIVYQLAKRGRRS
jgi:hypothetical protein